MSWLALAPAVPLSSFTFHLSRPLCLEPIRHSANQQPNRSRLVLSCSCLLGLRVFCTFFFFFFCLRHVRSATIWSGIFSLSLSTQPWALLPVPLAALAQLGQVEGGRVIRVTFDGGTADTMPWKFRPTQGDVKVIAAAVTRNTLKSVFTVLLILSSRFLGELLNHHLSAAAQPFRLFPPTLRVRVRLTMLPLPQVVPGETALAFFTAKNPTKKHITGVATYNVFPLKAGKCPPPPPVPSRPLYVCSGEN